MRVVVVGVLVVAKVALGLVPGVSRAARRTVVWSDDDFVAPSDSGDDSPLNTAPPAPEDVEAPSDVGEEAHAPPPGTAAAAAATASLEAELIALTSACSRATNRLAIEAKCRELEGLGTTPRASVDGVWALVYSSEAGLYRQSPFFWGFSQLLGGQSAPMKVLDARNDKLAEAVYAVTDALNVFYTIGDATHAISGCDSDGGYGGTFVSEVELSVRMPIPLPLPEARSVMTTTARAFPTPNGLGLTLEKTEVKDSSISKLPGLAFLADVAFPTEAAFDQLAELLSLSPNAATLECQLPYVSKTIKISRSPDGYVFVHQRRR